MSLGFRQLRLCFFSGCTNVPTFTALSGSSNFFMTCFLYCLAKGQKCQDLGEI